ncbi:cysteine dioxygenase [Frankia sp. AgKG'84/4]|uniref:cysteine dioxygenase n=1 Tax=Frankia sp. AgKG'84/4 TaxID=573490 RepID=UPI00200D71C9|nr:cysteine dioxygenase family protein [Frankia sp. AgKG'84/4]MCL9794943.1 cysteine dioxygenase family protein [Frankia sp. AgKG'84/4]
MPLLHPSLLSGPARRPEPFLSARSLSDEPGRIELPELRRLTAGLAARTDVWRPVIRHTAERRWYTRLLLSATVEVWLIGWYPGQQTEVHDHGGALGALTVVQGRVEEDRFDREWALTGSREHVTGSSAGFGAAHVHRVANRGSVAATTIHAYSPPELPMRYGPELAADGTQPAVQVALQPALTAAVAARPPVGAGSAR